MISNGTMEAAWSLFTGLFSEAFSGGSLDWQLTSAGYETSFVVYTALLVFNLLQLMVAGVLSTGMFADVVMLLEMSWTQETAPYWEGALMHVPTLMLYWNGIALICMLQCSVVYYDWSYSLFYVVESMIYVAVAILLAFPLLFLWATGSISIFMYTAFSNLLTYINSFKPLPRDQYEPKHLGGISVSTCALFTIPLVYFIMQFKQGLGTWLVMGLVYALYVLFSSYLRVTMPDVKENSTNMIMLTLYWPIFIVALVVTSWIESLYGYNRDFAQSWMMLCMDVSIGLLLCAGCFRRDLFIVTPTLILILMNLISTSTVQCVDLTGYSNVYYVVVGVSKIMMFVPVVQLADMTITIYDDGGYRMMALLFLDTMLRFTLTLAMLLDLNGLAAAEVKIGL